MFQAIGQTHSFKGKILDNAGKPIAGVSITIKETTTGAVSDVDGNFTVSTIKAFPLSIVLTSVGYNAAEFLVSTGSFNQYNLSEKIYLQEITLAATRVPTSILSSPVTIEKMGLNAINVTPAITPYDAIAYMKGVDFVTSSLTFKTPTTRGFNGSGSTRVNQWIDGMDNQAPGMNFSVGNFAGTMDVDMESIELLPGASSALFGPGGMCGTIVINSKNPFKYPGLTVQVKPGIMNVDKSQRPSVSDYRDWSLRYAKVLGERFAFKVGVQYLRATDWLANDSTNYNRGSGKIAPGSRTSDPNYDGINVYGDETSINIQPFIPDQFKPMFPGNIYVSRTGYSEQEVIDPVTKNLKLSAALHYKFNKNTEALIAGNYGTGNTVYTGSDRYVLKDIKIGQYKIELRNPNWFVRAYTTQENAGNSYAPTTLIRYLNEVWKPSEKWYGEYANTFIPAVLTGTNLATAHSLARAVADKGRPMAGSAEFNTIFNQLGKVPISKGGGLFVDRTNLYMTEGQYHLGKAFPYADILVGGNYKKYRLNSEGTIFIDSTGPILVSEYGGYLQATKKILKDYLTLAASARMDKNENFASKITPRFSALVKLVKDNNLRFSYQTAYRFPSTQQQYIKLLIGDHTYLLGGLPWIKEFMQLSKYPVLQITDGGLVPYAYKEFKPETSKTFEMGYKGLVQKKFFIDAYYYLSSYDDFLGRVTLYQPATSNYYSIVENSRQTIKTHGFGLSLLYNFSPKFSASSNFYSDKISDVPQGFLADYNTPAYRVNVGVAANSLGKKQKIGFGIQYKWQDSYLYQNDFATGILDAFSTLDAQVNYKLKSFCEVRLGATNVLNNYYKNGYGSPMIGGLYYASLKLDIITKDK